jgi:3-oxoadipate enol-lactonase
MPHARIDDGLEMYYEVHDFTDPWQQAETVVLHPGNLKDHRLWYAWIPLLARDYRVVTLDARGHGRSTVPPPGYPWSLENFARDLHGLLDRLEIPRAHLIGETTGGPITLQFAHDYPQRVLSVTQCTAYFKGGPSGPKPDDWKEIQAHGLAAWVQAKMGYRMSPGNDDPRYAQWYASVMSSHAQHVAEETLRYLGSMDMTETLGRIEAPTLILAGEHSETLPTWSQPMQALLPNSKLVVLPGAYGFVQHTAPRECVDAWRAFVDGLAASMAPALR